MGKLKAIDSKISNWIGVWWHPDIAMFTSASINIAELRKYKGNVRVCLRKNKAYQSGTNRPNYVLCIRDSQSAEGECIELFDDSEEIERKYTREEVRRVLCGACEDGRRGYSPEDLIIEDYV